MHRCPDTRRIVPTTSSRSSTQDTPAPATALVNPLERAKAARRQAIADAAATSQGRQGCRCDIRREIGRSQRAIVARIACGACPRDRAHETRRRRQGHGRGGRRESHRARQGHAAPDRGQDHRSRAGPSIRHARSKPRRPRRPSPRQKLPGTAERAGDEAAARLKSTERNTEPISIFVSRKAGRIYIRQAWAPIHEAPVTFKESELPLGTHIYLAAASDEAGARLRWLSVSLPPSRPVQPRGETRRDGQASPASLSAAPVARQPETAASVLERFELAEEPEGSSQTGSGPAPR